MSTLNALALGALLALVGCADRLLERPRTPARFAFQAFSSLEIVDLSTPDGAGALFVLGDDLGAGTLLRVDRGDELTSLGVPREPAGRPVAVSAQGQRVAVAFASGEVFWLGEGRCCRFDPAPLDLAPRPGGGFWVLTSSGLYEDDAPELRVAEGGLGLVPGPEGGVAILRTDGVEAFALSGPSPGARSIPPLRTGAFLPAGRLYGVDEEGRLQVVDGGRVDLLPDSAGTRAVAVDPKGRVWTIGERGIGRVSAGRIETELDAESSPILQGRFTRMQADARSLTLTSSTSLLRLVFAGS